MNASVALPMKEVSAGDFVLTGGELPAMTVINGVVRVLPGTVGTALSLVEESHSALLLEHPHYTRPAEFQGMAVPEVLRGGNHAAIGLAAAAAGAAHAGASTDLYARWRMWRR